MNTENHLIIIWENAMAHKDEFERIIADHVKIIGKVRYSWNSKLANNNYAAFYGEKLENIQYKTDHCGSGTFLVFIVEDQSPNYCARLTSSGERVVNATLFDLKAKLRELAGGGHLVHASDSIDEADLNCISLFGETMKSFLLRDCFRKNNEIEIARNITGAEGWHSWKELFDALALCTEYVVLRNYNAIIDRNKGEHGDTDILVRNRPAASTLIAGQKLFTGSQRVLYEVKIAGTVEQIDIRYLGDGYYCNDFEESILRNRILHESMVFYIPNPENEKYSVLYHAMVHKPFMAKDYAIYLNRTFETTGVTTLRAILDSYMTKKGYSYSRPSDTSVYINPHYFRQINLPAVKRLNYRLKFLKFKVVDGNGRESKRNSKIYKVLTSQYYMVLCFLRKVKSRIKK